MKTIQVHHQDNFQKKKEENKYFILHMIMVINNVNYGDKLLILFSTTRVEMKYYIKYLKIEKGITKFLFYLVNWKLLQTMILLVVSRRILEKNQTLVLIYTGPFNIKYLLWKIIQNLHIIRLFHCIIDIQLKVYEYFMSEEVTKEIDFVILKSNGELFFFNYFS